ncbi:MAG TPA: hypothetical protein VGL82_06570 [Bryobacteraceae bacterium]|jgi:hypothetical protein
MTPAAQIDGNPHGRIFYSLQVLVASLAGIMFVVGVFTTDVTPFPWRLARAGAAAVFLFGALQAFERLVRSKAAQARSAALSASARRGLDVMCKVVQGLSLLALAGSLMMRIASGTGAHDISVDLMLLWAVLLCLKHCLADLAGDPGFGVANRGPRFSDLK